MTESPGCAVQMQNAVNAEIQRRSAGPASGSHAPAPTVGGVPAVPMLSQSASPVPSASLETIAPEGPVSPPSMHYDMPEDLATAVSLDGDGNSSDAEEGGPTLLTRPGSPDPLPDSDEGPNEWASLFAASRQSRPKRARFEPSMQHGFFRQLLTLEQQKQQIHGEGLTYYEYLKLQREQLPEDVRRYYPFASAAEWSLARFLMTSGLSKNRTNEYLQLEWVRWLTLTLQSRETYHIIDNGSSTIIPQCRCTL